MNPARQEAAQNPCFPNCEAIVEGVTSALNAAVTQIAEDQLALFGAGFPPTLVSATQIEAILTTVSDPQISVVVHGGLSSGA